MTPLPTTDTTALAQAAVDILDGDREGAPPATTAIVDQALAEITTELEEFGVDPQDPHVARAYLALFHVVDAHVTIMRNEGCGHETCETFNLYEVIHEKLTCAAEAAARRTLAA